MPNVPLAGTMKQLAGTRLLCSALPDASSDGVSDATLYTHYYMLSVDIEQLPLAPHKGVSVAKNGVCLRHRTHSTKKFAETPNTLTAILRKDSREGKETRSYILLAFRRDGSSKSSKRLCQKADLVDRLDNELI